MTLRDWATPLTIGSFTLIAVTGILMFFHLDTGLNKEAHEWLSWALLAGVALHASANFLAFKRYFQRRTALVLMGAFVLILGLSFLPLSGKEDGKPLRIKANDALLSAPISLVAQVAGKDVQTVVAQLKAAGITVTAEQNLRQTAGDREDQMRALGVALSK